MKRSTIATSAVVVASCSASDPTASEEYQPLEQELTATQQQLADTDQQLGEVTAERDSLTGDGVSQDVGLGPVPDEVAALIDEWKHATATSMFDLYTPTGYHLYGAQKITGEGIGPHLVSPAIPTRP